MPMATKVYVVLENQLLHSNLPNIKHVATKVFVVLEGQPLHTNLPNIMPMTTKVCVVLRATSHTRSRACDLYTSSTLVGGKGGAGPSSLLHTTLEGPTEYVNARWM
jgi:hypothetical protein